MEGAEKRGKRKLASELSRQQAKIAAKRVEAETKKVEQAESERAERKERLDAKLKESEEISKELGSFVSYPLFSPMLRV